VFDSDLDIGYIRVNRLSQKSRHHIKISRRLNSDVKQVPYGGPKILDDTVRSLVVPAIRRFGFVHFCGPYREFL